MSKTEISATFTPGPWELRRAAKPDNTGGYDWAIVAPGKAIIAECFEHVDWRDSGVAYDVRPAEAHARLFVAAPDMLEALQLVADTYGFDPSVDSSVWQTVFAAIARATGQSVK